MVTILRWPTLPTVKLAGADGGAVQQDGAGAALAFAAAVFGAGEIEVVAQDAQEGAFALGVHWGVAAIDMKRCNFGHAGRLSITGKPDTEKLATERAGRPAAICLGTVPGT